MAGVRYDVGCCLHASDVWWACCAAMAYVSRAMWAHGTVACGSIGDATGPAGAWLGLIAGRTPQVSRMGA